MRIEEKRQALEKYCDEFFNENHSCKKCPLYSLVRGSGHTCYSDSHDNIITRNYKIIFGKDDMVEDAVNSPSHYTDGKIEVIDYIEDKKLGFCLGNAIKYISRAGKKDPSKEVEDLNKAIWYIKRRIKEIEEGIA